MSDQTTMSFGEDPSWAEKDPLAKGAPASTSHKKRKRQAGRPAQSMGINPYTMAAKQAERDLETVSAALAENLLKVPRTSDIQERIDVLETYRTNLFAIIKDLSIRTPLLLGDEPVSGESSLATMVHEIYIDQLKKHDRAVLSLKDLTDEICRLRNMKEGETLSKEQYNQVRSAITSLERQKKLLKVDRGVFAVIGSAQTLHKVLDRDQRALRAERGPQLKKVG